MWVVTITPARKRTYDGRGCMDWEQPFADAPSAHRWAKYMIEIKGAKRAQVEGTKE